MGHKKNNFNKITFSNNKESHFKQKVPAKHKTENIISQENEIVTQNFQMVCFAMTSWGVHVGQIHSFFQFLVASLVSENTSLQTFLILGKSPTKTFT